MSVIPSLSFYKHIPIRFLLWMYFTTCIAAYGWQIQVIPAAPAAFFVFLIGQLLVSVYLFFAHKTRASYYLPIHVFLWMFLFYDSQQYLFYGASGIFLVASIYYIKQANLPTWAKIAYIFLILINVGMSFVLHPVFLFAICTAYLVTILWSTHASLHQKIQVLVVVLLHVLTFATGAIPQFFPYQENMIFTLPMSFLLYVLYLTKASIRRSLFRLLFVDTLLFMVLVLSLLGYGIASYRSLYMGESHMFAGYIIATLMAAGGLVIMCLCIRRKQMNELQAIERGLNDWFVAKWEDALSQQEKNLSWSGFDSKLAQLFPNDGIRWSVKQEVQFASGCFMDPNFDAGKYFYADDSCLTVNETDVHQPFTIRQYYTAYALAYYLADKQRQWDQMSRVKLMDVEQGGSFRKDLQFRQEVTYYLHDNILQNIIATKNIVASLDAEQSALQELAVETLSDLNISIRSQMHEIYPSTLADLSFERNIHILLQETQKRYGSIPTPHVAYEISEQMDEQSAYLCYRTLQELLANTCKYAAADHIWIRVYDTADSWVMEVSEDGNPMKQEDRGDRIKHLGISSLKHQASALGGSFEWVQQEREKKFILRVPRRNNENSTV